MTNSTTQAVPPPSASRLALGGCILGFAILAKIVGPALIIGSDLSAGWKTAATIGLFVVIPKLLIVTIVFVLGKSGFAYLKSVCFKYIAGALAPLAPARQVSKLRYRIGLVMFILPLLEAWLIPYLESAFPGWAANRPIEWIWDVILIASFFVLGGDFWDKFRALFIHGATANFPNRESAAHA